MKRLFALILIGILCLSCFSFALAEDDNNLELSIGYVEGKKGEIVEIPFYAHLTIMSNTAGMDSLEFAVMHDQTQLKLIGAVKENGAIVSEVLNSEVVAVDNPTDEGYRFAMYTISTLQTSGVLMTLQYEKLTDDKATLTVTDCKYSYYDEATGEQPRYSIDTFTSVDNPSAAETVFLSGSAPDEQTEPASENNVIPELDDEQPATLEKDAQDAAIDDTTTENEQVTAGTPWYLWPLYVIAAAAIITGIVVAVTRTKNKEQ